MAISKTKVKSVRLSKDIVPERYAIKLKPDLERFTFEGEETIAVNLLKSPKEITLHSRELDIEVAEIVEKDKKIFATKISYDEKAEPATFHFPVRIPQGEAKLRL